MQNDLIPFIPFEKLRGRTLVWCYLLTTFLCSIIFFEQGPLHKAIVSLLFYVIFLVCISLILFRSRLSYKQLFGVFLKWSTVRKYILWTIPLILFSVLVFYLQYLPLHYLMPGLADWLFVDRDTTPDLPIADKYLLANIIFFIDIVILAPVFEEFFIRGILLTRWSIKWNTPKAIFASSLLFGILHVNILGAVFFGYVMCVLYIRTKSLFVPICVHMVNNLIAWIIGVVHMPLGDASQVETSIVLETSESLGLMAIAVIIIPWTINLVWKNFPKDSWRVPYLLETRFFKRT